MLGYALKLARIHAAARAYEVDIECGLHENHIAGATDKIGNRPLRPTANDDGG
jgi:hypothetical protein